MSMAQPDNLTQQLIERIRSLTARPDYAPTSQPNEQLGSQRVIDNEMQSCVNQLERELAELQQLRALTQMWGQLHASLDLQTVLQQALNLALELTNAERGYILWCTSGRLDINFRIVHAVEHSPDAPGIEIKHTLVNQVVETGRPRLATSDAPGEMRSILCVPLKRETGVVFGVIYIGSRAQTSDFNRADKNLLAAFAAQAALAIENAREYGKLKSELTKATREIQRIEIDQSQVERQVSDVTDSVFFRDLQSRVAIIRARDQST
jgi:GAF domain-containing protein